MLHNNETFTDKSQCSSKACFNWHRTHSEKHKFLLYISIKNVTNDDIGDFLIVTGTGVHASTNFVNYTFTLQTTGTQLTPDHLNLSFTKKTLRYVELKLNMY